MASTKAAKAGSGDGGDKPEINISLCFDFAPRPGIPQMLKFSSYGFLKNQTYFLPFLLLFFRSKGLTYTQFGWLMTWNEVIINVVEIPAGAVSDSSGRRITLVASFSLYMICFLGLTCSQSFSWILFFFTFYSGGEAFRGGTHKAMIIEWLRLHGRKDLKVQVYGYTRMWSKLGNALSSVIGGAMVAITGGYHWIFIFSLIPYVINSLNVLSYPPELDGKHIDQAEGISVSKAFANTRGTLASALREFKNPAVSGFCLEALLFESPFRVAKGYLQPLLHLAAAGYATQEISITQATGILVGSVNFFLFLLASYTSVNAYKIVKWCGSEQQTAAVIWLVTTVTYVVLTLSFVMGWTSIAALCFVALFGLHSVWRPLLISRLTNNSNEALAATVLSVEAQSVSFGTAVFAPLVGFAVDTFTQTWGRQSTAAFWAVPSIGMAAGFVGSCICLRLSSRASLETKGRPLLDA